VLPQLAAGAEEDVALVEIVSYRIDRRSRKLCCAEGWRPSSSFGPRLIFLLW
jgi:hypothetical protein